MSEPLELLSKADIMRLFKYPEHQLDADLRDGKLPFFMSKAYYGRYYIPRKAVEERILELTMARKVK